MNQFYGKCLPCSATYATTRRYFKGQFKMKGISYLLVISYVVFLSTQFSNALPIEETVANSPLAVLKQKIATLNLLPVTSLNIATNTVAQHPLKFDFPEASFLTDFVKTIVAHIKAETNNETKIEISTTTVAPSTTTLTPQTTESSLEEKITQNYEDALLREVYMDWGKRHTRQIVDDKMDVAGVGEATEQLQLPPADIDPEILLRLLQLEPEPTENSIAQEPEALPVQPAVNPTVIDVPPSYSYPPQPEVAAAADPSSFYPFGMLDPMAAYKIQKEMAKAQMKAALAAMKPTTTPKPTKIKLKFSIPAGATLPPALQGYLVP